MHLTSPVLVGRRGEFSTLRAAVERAREGRGGAVFLVGEPGIGKSRLTSEVVTDATTRGCRVLRGRASGGAPLRALAEVVSTALRRRDAPTEAQLGAYWPVLRRLSPDAPAGLPDPHVVRSEALLRLCSATGTHEATVLLLEDLHEADKETLVVVDHLLDGLADQAVLVLATTRPHPPLALEFAESAEARGVASVQRLSGLGDADTAELVAQCLEIPASEVPAEVIAHLHRDARGVPFVVEELLAAMIESTVLRPDHAIWRVHGDVRAQLPPDVTAAILHRVDRLAARGVALLEAAAVLGRNFPLAVAATVAGLAPDDAVEQLRGAAQAQLVGVGSDDGETPAFRHALTADAILSRLTAAQREALSCSAAQAVESMRPQETELAANLWAAGGATARAVHLLVQAGRRAADRGLLTSAVELLERGLSILDPHPDPALEADLLDTLAAVLVHIGDADRAFAAGERLGEALAAMNAPPARLAAAHVAQARAATVATQWERGLDHIESARRLLGTDEASVDAVAATLILNLDQVDRLPEARALAERAALAAGDEQPDVACEALDVLTRCTRGHDLARSRGYVERWRSIAEAHGLVAWRIRALLELGVTERYLCSSTTGLLAARQAAYETGAVLVIIAIDLHLAHTHILRGEYDEAARRSAGAATAAARLRLHGLVMLAVAIDAGIAAARGDRETTDEALGRLREEGDAGYGNGEEVWAYCSAMCALVEEQPERALADFAEADRATTAIPIIRGSYFFFRGPYLLLRVTRGRAGWAEYEELADSHLAQLHVHRTYLLWSQAVLLGRDGQVDAAADAAAQAIALSADLGLPRFLGARLVAACALADGWGSPVEWLRDAAGYFEGHGTHRVADACRALLRGN
ncbi:AAA family ATPase [Lentzea tibetensis]|uniref:AAA family ATPase n=1 Tax=Lentzea tibetensis TaxID=2591470 RepID=A0A563EHC9_9PSEU|nr:AAA family ATPase [Lentzea tibetensis]TWP45743.1 AAA family ATPase [Lentzea tibetensis]